MILIYALISAEGSQESVTSPPRKSFSEQERTQIDRNNSGMYLYGFKQLLLAIQWNSSPIWWTLQQCQAAIILWASILLLYIYTLSHHYNWSKLVNFVSEGNVQYSLPASLDEHFPLIPWFSNQLNNSQSREQNHFKNHTFSWIKHFFIENS